MKRQPIQRAVVSVDGSPALEWQSQLLARTWQTAGMTNPITRLWANPFKDPTPWPWDTYRHTLYSDWDRHGNYLPYNRVLGLRDWTRSGQVHDADTVLVLDPDMVFTGRIPNPSLASGDIAGHPWGFLQEHVNDPANAEFVVDHCSQIPERVPWVGYPYAMRGSDLAVFTELLPERVKRIRADGGSPSGWWVDEMWAFAFTVADMALRAHHTDWVADVCDVDQPWPRPIMHYAWSVTRGWNWYKKTWRPDLPVPPITDGATAPTKAFARLLTVECATLTEHAA